jgi:hypothetical protein
MSVTELAKSVQFTVNQEGHVTAVVLSPAVWQQILDALEDSEDRQLVESLRTRLAQGPVSSSALRFEEIASEWQ